MGETSRTGQAIAKVLESLENNLGALSANSLKVKPSRSLRADMAKIVEIVGPHKYVQMRCRLAGPSTGILDVAWPLPAAISLTAGYRSMPSEDIAAAREMKLWEGENEATFEEVAVLMTASIQEAIQDSLGKGFTVEVESHDVVEELVAEDAKADFYAAPFTFRAHGLPSNHVMLYFPIALAEEIDGGPINFEKADDDDFFDDFEPAEIRGGAVAYVNSADTVRLLRRACRRVGLTLNKRPKSEVPNPACYSKVIIIIEIGLGQARRYDWCRRLKQSAKDAFVLLLIHDPTRPAVARAFCSSADGILRSPARERELSRKLGELLNALAPEETSAA